MAESKSQIIINVEKDENHVPENITWTSTDSNIKDKPSKAMILSMWDDKQNTALRIDIWEKEMTIDEMKLFVHQTMVTLSDSFEKATGEEQMAMAMRDFCEYFAEKMKLYES